MKRIALLCLLVAAPILSQETRCYSSQCQKGGAAGYASRDATTLSMMGWGLGLAVGIATLCALIDDNPSTSH